MKFVKDYSDGNLQEFLMSRGLGNVAEAAFISQDTYSLADCNVPSQEKPGGYVGWTLLGGLHDFCSYVNSHGVIMVTDGFFHEFFANTPGPLNALYHVEPLDQEDPWCQGFDAADVNVPLDQCPYAQGTHQRQAWRNGWYMCQQKTSN